MRVTIVCVLGRGGSGKDTQVELITEPFKPGGIYNLPYVRHAAKISTGNLVRGALNPQSHLYAKYNSEVAPYTADTHGGKLISDEVIIGMAQQELAELLINGGKTLFFFTGFPRTGGQLIHFDAWISDLQHDIEVATHFVSLYVPEELSRERAEMRREQAKREGVALRKDDREDVVETRLVEFRRYTQPVLNQLYEEGRLVNINAQRSIAVIQQDVRRLLHLGSITDPEGRFVSHEQLSMTHPAWRK